MKLKKMIGIILTLAMIFSLCSCFTVTVTIVDPNANGSAPAGNTNAPDVLPSETDAPESVSPSETEAPESESPSETESQSEAPSTNAPESTSAPENTTAAPEVTEAPAKTPDQMSNEELLTLFNTSLNKVKSDKAGFKKSKLTTIVDLQLSNSAANTLVGFVKSSLLSETADETTVGKGQSSTDVMSPSGKAYVSSLAMSDITSITCTASGGSYVIKVAVKGETNPAEGGSLSKVFDYMTVDDVVNIYAPKVGATVAREDIEVVFSDCTATLTVDANGTVQGYSTYVKGVMNMYNASIKKVVTINTDLAITLASTTDYTNFSY